MFRVTVSVEFPALWVVVMDDAERGEVRMSGPFSDVFWGLHVRIPELEARYASI